MPNIKKSQKINPELKARIIEQIKKRSGPMFAIFDFDNTCIVNDITEATLTYICKNRLLRDFSLLDGDNTDIDLYHKKFIQTYYQLLKDGKIFDGYLLIVKMFSGFTKKEAEHIVLQTIKSEGKNIGSSKLYGVKIAHGLKVQSNIISLINYLKLNKIKVHILSASSEIAVAVATKYFKIDTDNIIGMKHIIKNGIITSSFKKPYSILGGKVDCMRKYISRTKSPLLVADDSNTGISILETSSIKVVVNRNNELTKIAKKRKWFLI